MREKGYEGVVLGGCWNEATVASVLRGFCDALTELKSSRKQREALEQQLDILRNDADLHQKERDKLNLQVISLSRKIAMLENENSKAKKERSEMEKKMNESLTQESKSRQAIQTKEKAFEHELKKERMLRDHAESKVRKLMANNPKIGKVQENTRAKDAISIMSNEQEVEILEKLRIENVELRKRLIGIYNELSKACCETQIAQLQMNMKIQQLDANVLAPMVCMIDNLKKKEIVTVPSPKREKENKNFEEESFAKIMVCFYCFYHDFV